MSVDPDKLAIVLYPAPVLREKAQPIEVVDETVRAVAKRMIELMHQAPGVGLAAPQVGLPWRMFVANPTGQEGDDRVYINPRLELGPDLAPRDEGCLSLPNISVEVKRPTSATIHAIGLDGQPFEESSEDELLAIIWQHEYDHLDGVLIIDKMGPMDRMANRKAIKELEAS